MSQVMQALYGGRREEAEVAAVGHDLDVFESAALGRASRLRQLLEADPGLAHAWSDDGFLAVHYACYFGTPDCAEALLDAGAPWDEPSRNDMGVRPINAAAAGPHPFDTISLLIGRGVDVDGRQASGHTALDEAIIRQDDPVANLLRSHGATEAR